MCVCVGRGRGGVWNGEEIFVGTPNAETLRWGRPAMCLQSTAKKPLCLKPVSRREN